MYRARIAGLDLKKTAESGQCFRFLPADGGAYRIAAGCRYVRVTPLDGEQFEFSCDETEYESFWRAYFDADADYERWIGGISAGDAFLREAAEFGRGIRILRQEPWETLVTFILSQRKNISAIRCCVEALCRACGEELPGAGGLYAFPSPERVAAAAPEKLAACSFGYRLPYVRAAAELAAAGALDADRLRELPDERLRETLLTVPGVGPKIADCVMLFGYHRLSAFPRDVWIGRAVEQRYGGVFPADDYPDCAGVMQQYIFYYMRSGRGGSDGRTDRCDRRAGRTDRKAAG